MRCSTPDCTADAVIQWQQTGTPEQGAAHVDALRANLVAINEAQRLQIRLGIAQLQFAHDNPLPILSAEDRARFQAQAVAQIEAARAEHNAITDDVNLDHHAQVTVARFACTEHDHGDLDWYARLHTSTCDGTTGCGCEVPS